MSDSIFIDSNILVHAINSIDDTYKRNVSKNLLLQNPCVSPQVLFEWINVSRRKFKLPKQRYLELLDSLLSICEVVDENQEVVLKSIELLNTFSLQPFDAKIVATALHHSCNILYSEDMQNGLVINNKLTIINPFLNK